MKKEMLRYILMAGVAILSACSSNDDFLKENLYGKLFPESFFRNPEELTLANNALYSSLNGVFSGDDSRYMIGFFGGDDITTPYSYQTPFVQNDIFVHQASNAQMRSGYNGAYGTINIANAIIANYQNAKGTLSNEKLLYFAGQAHFARAYLYFWLVRFFNDIPYVTTARVIDRTMKPSPPEEVYEHIIADLKIAEEWLPQSWNGIDQLLYNGAAFTKGAAKATLASVYLTMAGYPLKKTEYYKLAAEKAKEIIDKESEYGYRLVNHCQELWSPFPKINSEVVFATVYNKIGGYSSRAPKEGRPVQFGGFEGYCAEINFFLRFPAGERREATFVYEFPLPDGSPAARPVIPWPADKPMLSWQDMRFAHPYYNKMWESEESYGSTKFKQLNESEWNSGRTNQMIRYAEVLLIYAEAQAMADGAPNTLAYNCINRVRNRAYAGAGSTGKELQPGLSATAFRDSVFVERGWEFAGFEMASRWFDLVRFELVEDAAKETPANKFLPGRSPKEWEILSPPTKQSYFFPIPEEDAKLNPNLL